MVKHLDYLKIVLAYSLFGCLWIYLSDGIVSLLFNDTSSIFQYSKFKGLFFIIITSFLLYFLIAGLVSRINKSLDDLHEREELLKFLVNNSADSLVIVNADGSQRYVSPGAEKITGFPVSDLEGRTLDTILHPDDMHAIKKAWDEAVENPEKTVTVQYRHIHKSGGWIYSEAVAQSFFNDPSINGLLATVRDVTERKLIEESLSRQEALMQSMLRNLPFDFWARDTKDNVLMQSDKSIELWGDLKETPKENCIIPLTTLERWKKNNDQVLGGQIVSEDCSLIGKDGIQRDYHSVVAPIRDGENILGIIGVNIDITDKKLADEALRESEERLQLVMEGSQLGYWDWNIETGEVRRNKRWAEMLGYTLQEVEYSVKQWTDLHHPDDRAAAWESIQNHLDGKTPAHRIEYRMLAKDGQYKWILDQARVVKRNASGEPIRMSGTHTDITERKSEEAEREKLQAQLAQAQKMESVGRLAGGVAHDFNNMLSVILGYTEIIMEDTESDRAIYRKLQEIQKAAQHSASITRQLLAFARKQTTAPKVLELNETVEGMLRMLRRLIGEDINLNWVPGENLDLVRIDPSQIDQILANLCVNARDAIAGTGKITIETANVSLDQEYCNHHNGFVPGDYVLLAISDNGCGMDQQTLAHLFEPFFTTKDVDKGTGLGLAMVYGVVKQNNGFINVYSELGYGTTFKIYLPPHHSKTDTIQELSKDHSSKYNNETILLVEDEQAILEMIKLMLEKMGYQVIAAGTPGEAIRLAQDYSSEIHLLITDVIMPEMNGRDLAKNIITIYPNLKRLFMSGYTANVIAHHGVLDEGINFIQKPFSKKALGDKVQEILQKAG